MNNNLFVPENVVITSEAKKFARTNEILSRILKSNPNVNVSYSKDERPVFPQGFSPSEKYHYMKKTLVLSCRKSPFIETFASPGRIVEKLNIMVKAGMNCCYQCQYCYLQRTAMRQPWQKIHVNLEGIEKEMLNEVKLHPLWLTTLSVYDYCKGSDLDKIPKNFKKVTDKLRNTLTDKGKKSIDEYLVRQYTRISIKEIIEEIDKNVDKVKLEKAAKDVLKIFDENKKIKPQFNISEYTDILGINHISGQLDYFLNLIEKHKELRIAFFSKSDNVDDILKYNGDGRVDIIIHLDPQYVIDTYQVGTPSLNERFIAAKKIQNTSGFNLKLQLEPIVKYNNYENDYSDIINRIGKELDLSKISRIKFGSVRYASQLKSVIINNYPNTNLFDTSQALVPPIGKDRWRYSLNERVKIYDDLMGKMIGYGNVKIGLGAENPETWSKLRHHQSKSISNFYYKYQ